MHVDTPISMPPSKPAWFLLYRRRVLVFAFTISVVLHLFAWLATPHFTQAWQEPAYARYDAVLVPMVKSPTAPVAIANIRSKPARRATRSITPKPAPELRAETSFTAPENAIAIDRAPDTGNENSRQAALTDEKTAILAESKENAASLPAIAEATQSTGPTTIDKKQPDSSPPELPSRISIAYKMTSSISDGVADYTWTRDGDRFEIDSTMQATGFLVGNFVGALHQVSRGLVTPTGLQPNSFRIRRGEGAPDTADFLRASNELKLTRAGDARLVPMPPLIQDMQSFLFQLAYDAPKMKGPDDRLDVMVTNARKVYRHRFRRVGIEAIQTRAGAVETVHLRSEASDPEDTYEVWLTPGNYYLPVKIKFYAGRFPVELIATSIRTTP